MRVIIYREERNDKQLRALLEEIRQSLRAMGCSTELSHLLSLITVDIPPEVNYQSVATFLSEKERQGLLGSDLLISMKSRRSDFERKGQVRTRKNRLCGVEFRQ